MRTASKLNPKTNRSLSFANRDAYNNDMKRHSIIKKIERKIRSSMLYHEWVKRNISHCCANCDSSEELQMHHIVELYHIVFGLWKLYSNPDSVFAHCIARHADDGYDAITLCKTCHDKIHAGRRFSNQQKEVRVSDWAAMPRILPGTLLHHSTTASDKGLSLVSVQLLAGIGWHILQGHMESRIIELQRPSLAKLLGKTSTTSFMKSIVRAVNSLKSLDVICGHHVCNSSIEVHLCQSYLEGMASSPWFISINDVRTSRMPVFALRWFLGHQSKRRNYKIGKDNLVANLGLKTSYPYFVDKCVRSAAEETSWIEYCGYDGNFMSFKLNRRGAVPIFSLRDILIDSINDGT